MEFTWEKRPLRELLRLSWPIATSLLSYSCMTLVDTLLVGRLGRAEIAGVGLAGMVAFSLICFPMGILQGGKALIAQAVGARRPEEARAVLGASLASAVGLGVLALLAGQLLAEAAPLLTSTPASGQAARTYLRVRTLGAPLVTIFIALREWSYAHGRTRPPMVATLVANACNALLAVLFIYGLGFGVAGAAAATIVAHGVEVGTLFLLSRKHGLASGRPRRADLVRLWRIGLPSGIQFVLEVGSFTMLSVLISLMSEVDMAGHQIALQIIHFSFLPALAVGEAASVLAGHAIGAGRDWLVIRVARRAALLALCYMGCFALLFLGGAEAIASRFTRDAQVLALAVSLLHLAAAFQLLDAANVVGRCVLRGTGDVRYAAVIGVASAWFCVPPLTWLLGHRLHLGARGGWLGITCEVCCAAALFWWRLERKGWKPAADRTRQELMRSTGQEPAREVA
jgi:MATE family multidrug resistance protein